MTELDVTHSVIVEKSRMVKGGRGGLIHPPANSERARELNAIRWNRTKRLARLGVGDAALQKIDLAVADYLPAAKDLTSEEMAQAMAALPNRVRQELMVRKAFEEHAMNMTDPSARGSTASLRAVMDYAFKPDAEPVQQQVIPNADVSELKELLCAFRQWKQGISDGL